uniref:Uncharacterized protein n=1 Tax=Arundo donax TaxID=35708 RepID=A0A0A9FZS6_ARUDO
MKQNHVFIWLDAKRRLSCGLFFIVSSHLSFCFLSPLWALFFSFVSLICVLI